MGASDIHPSLFILISVYPSLCVSLSICLSSICLSVPMFFAFSRTFADPVVHWDLSYNFLPLLSHFSMLSQYLLVANKSSAVCMTLHVCNCVWLFLGVCVLMARQHVWSSNLALLIQIKGSLLYGDESLCSDRRPGRPRLASLIIIDKCQRNSYCVDL